MRSHLELEFLVSASGRLTKERHASLLQEGRAKQAEAPEPPSKWQVTLSNGARVEFVGVCENPSGGKQWWGPDGSPLGYAPYLNYERYAALREDRKVYEIAWRIAWPAAGPSGARCSLEGVRGSFGRQIRDRYGVDIHSGLDAQGYAFEKSRRTTTLRLGVRVGEGAYEWVRFENISLVPGEDPGFVVVEGPNEAGGPG
jgi:hypothetical protein